jgi:hypothetical protein
MSKAISIGVVALALFGFLAAAVSSKPLPHIKTVHLVISNHLDIGFTNFDNVVISAVSLPPPPAQLPSPDPFSFPPDSHLSKPPDTHLIMHPPLSPLRSTSPSTFLGPLGSPTSCTRVEVPSGWSTSPSRSSCLCTWTAQQPSMSPAPPQTRCGPLKRLSNGGESPPARVAAAWRNPQDLLSIADHQPRFLFLFSF